MKVASSPFRTEKIGAMSNSVVIQNKISHLSSYLFW